jgi:hypothetical protein
MPSGIANMGMPPTAPAAMALSASVPVSLWPRSDRRRNVPDNYKAKWLAGLKVGDLVMVRSLYSKVRRCRRIIHLTPMFFVIDNHQWFLRSNGHRRSKARSHWRLEMPAAAQARKAKAGKGNVASKTDDIESWRAKTFGATWEARHGPNSAHDRLFSGPPYSP